MLDAVQRHGKEWAKLACVAGATLVFLCGMAESAARLFYPTTTSDSGDCLVMNDTVTGIRGKPGCVVSEQIVDSGLITYRFNASGDRSIGERSQKSADVFRIVLVGSSIAEGLRVNREETTAAVLPALLSRQTGRHIELYNEGIQWGTPHHVDLHFNDILTARPDLVLWMVTIWDIEHADEIGPSPAPADQKENRSLMARARTFIPHSRMLLVARHWMLNSPTGHIRQFLKNQDASGFLAVNPGPRYWQDLAAFSRYACSIGKKAKSAGVPLLLLDVPERAQVELIAKGEWPHSMDPYRIGNDIRQVAEYAGARYLDVLSGFRTVPDPGADFFPIDAHPSAAGHAVLTRLIADQMLRMNVLPRGEQAKR